MQSKKQHKDATKTLDHTKITGRLGTVSWSDKGIPNGVVNIRLMRPIFPLSLAIGNQKDKHLKEL